MSRLVTECEYSARILWSVNRIRNIIWSEKIARWIRIWILVFGLNYSNDIWIQNYLLTSGGQLNRWPCHWVTDWVTQLLIYWFWNVRWAIKVLMRLIKQWQIQRQRCLENTFCDLCDLWLLRHLFKVMKSQDLTNKKTMAMTKTKTMIMTRLMTKAILETCDLWDIDCMTIENLNSWQSLWSDNLHCTAFTIFAMFFTNDMNTINFIIIIIWSRCLQLFLIHGTAGSATLRSPRGFKSLCTRTTSSLWLPMHILRPQCMRRRAEPKVYLCATETRYCCPLDSQPDYEISTFSLIAL